MGKTMKQTTINFKKKTSGKNPWESDSDDNSFSNSETQEDSPIVPKRTVTSRNKTTKKYTIESSEDENENFSSSEDEGDFKSAKIDSPQMPKKKPVSKTQMTKVVPLKKGPVTKKTSKVDFSSSEEEASLSDDFSGVDSSSSPPRATTGRSRATAKKQKYTFSDSDSDF